MSIAGGRASALHRPAAPCSVHDVSAPPPAARSISSPRLHRSAFASYYRIEGIESLILFLARVASSSLIQKSAPMEVSFTTCKSRRRPASRSSSFFQPARSHVDACTTAGPRSQAPRQCTRAIDACQKMIWTIADDGTPMPRPRPGDRPPASPREDEADVIPHASLMILADTCESTKSHTYMPRAYCRACTKMAPREQQDDYRFA